MSQRNTNLTYPQLRLPRSGWWLSAVGTVITVALFVFPKITVLTYYQCIFSFIFLLLLITTIVLILYAFRRFCVFARRALQYENLTKMIIGLKSKLDSTERSLTALLKDRQNRNAFEVAYCYAYAGRTFIALKKKSGPAPTAGADVIVTDSLSGTLLGTFQILKNGTSHYIICQKTGHMDAVWLGNIIRCGTQHSEAPPEAIAWVLPNALGENNEQPGNPD